MSEFLATSPALPGEAPTVEGRLADIIEMDDAVIQIDEYKLSQADRTRVVAALRLAASAATPGCDGLEQGGLSPKTLDPEVVLSQGGSKNDGAPWPRGESMQTDATRPVGSPNISSETGLAAAPQAQEGGGRQFPN